MGKIAQQIIRHTGEIQTLINQGRYKPDVAELAFQYDLIAKDAACEARVNQAINHTGMWPEKTIDQAIKLAYDSLNL